MTAKEMLDRMHKMLAECGDDLYDDHNPNGREYHEYKRKLARHFTPLIRSLMFTGILVVDLQTEGTHYEARHDDDTIMLEEYDEDEDDDFYADHSDIE